LALAHGARDHRRADRLGIQADALLEQLAETRRSSRRFLGGLQQQRAHRLGQQSSTHPLQQALRILRTGPR
jgi:hypothetical protein